MKRGHWMVCAGLAVAGAAVGQTADEMMGPVIEQVSNRAGNCLSLPEVARRDCVLKSYQGGVFERLVVQLHTYGASRRTLGSAYAALIAARSDKQIGSAAESGGTTTLAMKGYAPRILSLAVEQGAISQRVDKNIVTFRATPAGLADAFRKVDLDQVLALYRPLDGQKKPVANIGKPAKMPEWAYRVSFAVSFDTTRGAGQDPVLLANKQQVASWGGRVILVNQRNAESARYATRWKDLSRDHGSAYHDEVGKATKAVEARVEVKTALEALNKAVEAELTDADLTPGSEIALGKKLGPMVLAAVKKAKEAIDTAEPEFLEKVQLKSISAFFDGQTSIYKHVNKGILSTLDYTVTRDPAVPDLSTITFIAEGGLGRNRQWDWTLNAGFSFYNASAPQLKERFHSFKAASQLDVPLGKYASLGPFVLQLAGRFQRIPNATLTPGTGIVESAAGDAAPSPGTAVVAATPAGNVGIGQVKLLIPAGDSGVKIPLSFSVSNRAGMIQEKTTFSATVGLTFDLDALFARDAAK